MGSKTWSYSKCTRMHLSVSVLLKLKPGASAIPPSDLSGLQVGSLPLEPAQGRPAVCMGADL